MKTSSTEVRVQADQVDDSNATTDATLPILFQATNASRWSLFRGWLAYREGLVSHCHPFSKTKVSTERRPRTDATTYSPIYCSDVDSSRSTWHCPSNCQPLHTKDPAVVHMSRGTAACIQTYYTACMHQQLLSILSRHRHRCNMLKKNKQLSVRDSSTLSSLIILHLL